MAVFQHLLLTILIVSLCACQRRRPRDESGSLPDLASTSSPAQAWSREASPLPVAPPATPAAGSAAPAAKLSYPDGGTVNGDPNGPRAEVLNRIAAAAVPAVTRCLDQTVRLDAGELQLSVHYAILPTGATSKVAVQGSAPTATLDCVRDVIQALQFPAFSGKAVENTSPFTYRRAQSK